MWTQISDFWEVLWPGQTWNRWKVETTAILAKIGAQLWRIQDLKFALAWQGSPSELYTGPLHLKGVVEIESKTAQVSQKKYKNCYNMFGERRGEKDTLHILPKECSQTNGLKHRSRRGQTKGCNQESRFGLPVTNDRKRNIITKIGPKQDAGNSCWRRYTSCTSVKEIPTINIIH